MPKIQLKINQTNYEFELNGNETLLEVLRNHLGLTGTKTACEESECGTCTVQLNGKAVLSCITLACDLEGEEIMTIEGLAQGEKLHPVQQAFLDYGAVQCGFCIPGMIISAKALLERNSNPGIEEIQYALDGNICRCAGYPKIFNAVLKAGEAMRMTDKRAPNHDLDDETIRPQMDQMNCGITYNEYTKGLDKT